MQFDDNALSWKFFSAGGPGGQHVNKVATAAMLRADVAQLGLNEYTMERLAGKMTKDGAIVIIARRYKSQEQNKADALERLAAMITKAREVPKYRRKTKPTRASGERRLTGKKVRSGIKAGRGKVSE